jgi:hypothetical protein
MQLFSSNIYEQRTELDYCVVTAFCYAQCYDVFLVYIYCAVEYLTLNGRNNPFVNNVKYLCVIFDERITWRLHVERIEAKAFRTFIRLNPLFRSERLTAKIKLTLLKALIKSVMTYA